MNVLAVGVVLTANQPFRSEGSRLPLTVLIPAICTVVWLRPKLDAEATKLWLTSVVTVTRLPVRDIAVMTNELVSLPVDPALTVPDSFGPVCAKVICEAVGAEAIRTSPLGLVAIPVTSVMKACSLAAALIGEEKLTVTTLLLREMLEIVINGAPNTAGAVVVEPAALAAVRPLLLSIPAHSYEMVDEPLTPTVWIVGAAGVDWLVAGPALSITIPSPFWKSIAEARVTLGDPA